MNSSKNYVLLIGNGFDIAHGHETSYLDFADYLLIQLSQRIFTHLSGALASNPYFDDRANINLRHIALNKRNDVNQDFQDLFEAFLKSETANSHKYIHEVLIEKYLDKLQLILANKFMAGLFRNRSSSNNWFDIENMYFKNVKDIALRKPYQNQRLKNLNKDFNDLKTELSDYLNNQNYSVNKEIHSYFGTLAKSIDSLTIINFNYTPTLDNYQKLFPVDCEIFNIHGTLKKGNIIFGYGNDQNDEYRRILELEEDEPLKNFKTFEYLRDGVYSSLLERIGNFSDYEVYVIGHSLALTDKTILEEVFSRKECSSINLLKRTDLKNESNKIIENFKKLSYAVARVIEDDKIVRKIIVDQDRTMYFP
ncbi:AbiH family protein [Lutimonas halocynthiae]|uniref:AbiH family protein n=1 Tax=Lutimonas halocynthiae TaxID=1446477 RepID=UPI0025B6122B|nr:AbiH family protein [Lutimonas halocynthiae]MDN3643751.1 AbiH family protein [Lutimonas halocynthiae]